MPTPAAPLLDSDAIIGDSFVGVGILVSAVGSLIALAAALRYGPKLIRFGLRLLGR